MGFKDLGFGDFRARVWGLGVQEPRHPAVKGAGRVFGSQP